MAIGPDLSERYLDTIYHTNWLQDIYGEDVLNSHEVPADSWASSATSPARWRRRLDLQSGDRNGNQRHQLQGRKT